MGKILIIKGADFSAVAVGTVTPIEPTGAPVITISSSGSVTIACEGATSIYYTTNGSTPTTSSTKYTSAFTVSNGTTVKAIAEFSGGTTSSVSSKTYTSGGGSIGIKTYGDTTEYKDNTGGYMSNGEDETNSGWLQSSWQAKSGVQADGQLKEVYIPFGNAVNFKVYIGRIDQNGYFVETSHTDTAISGNHLVDVSAKNIRIASGELAAVVITDSMNTQASRGFEYTVGTDAAWKAAGTIMSIAGKDCTTRTPLMSAQRVDGVRFTYYFTVDHDK